MEPFLEKLNKAKRDVRLPDERREFIRARLIQFMQADAAVRSQHDTRPARRVFWAFKRMSVTAAALIVALVGGSTTFAAQAALPGELLYPVKVNFTEKVAASVRLTNAAKAAYETNLAERRIEEATVLAAEGKITPETRGEVETRFNAHTNEARRRITTEETDGDVRVAAGLASDFEAALRVRGTVLGKIANARENKRNEIESLETAIRTSLDDMTQLREELEIRVSQSDKTDVVRNAELRVAAETRIRDAEKTALKIRERLDGTGSSLNTDTRAQVGEELDAADEALAEARMKLSTGDYGDAFNLGNATIRSSHEAEVILKSGTRLNANLRHNTDDERGRRSDGPATASSTTTSTLERTDRSDRQDRRKDEVKQEEPRDDGEDNKNNERGGGIDLDLRLGR